MGENMNVLYISNLTGNLFAGPNNSVPAQIKAQSKRDNVFWYNINDIKREEWKEINCYNLKDYPSGRLKDLPKPFNKPDIAVIEEFYCFPFCKIIKDINENNISIYVEGSGSKTLVFLSGSGTCSPILDFKSLYSLLSDE